MITGISMMLCFSSFLPRSCEPLGKSLFKSLGKVLTVDFIYHASLPHPPGFPTWDLQSPEVLKNQQRGRGRGRGPNLIAVSDFQYYKTMPSGKGTLSSDKAIRSNRLPAFGMDYVNSKAIYIVLMKHSSLLFLPNKTINKLTPTKKWGGQ